MQFAQGRNPRTKGVMKEAVLWNASPLGDKLAMVARRALAEKQDSRLYGRGTLGDRRKVEVQDVVDVIITGCPQGLVLMVQDAS